MNKSNSNLYQSILIFLGIVVLLILDSTIIFVSRGLQIVFLNLKMKGYLLLSVDLTIYIVFILLMIFYLKRLKTGKIQPSYGKLVKDNFYKLIIGTGVLFFLRLIISYLYNRELAVILNKDSMIDYGNIMSAMESFHFLFYLIIAIIIFFFIGKNRKMIDIREGKAHQ